MMMIQENKSRPEQVVKKDCNIVKPDAKLSTSMIENHDDTDKMVGKGGKEARILSSPNFVPSGTLEVSPDLHLRTNMDAYALRHSSVTAATALHSLRYRTDQLGRTIVSDYVRNVKKRLNRFQEEQNKRQKVQAASPDGTISDSDSCCSSTSCDENVSTADQVEKNDKKNDAAVSSTEKSSAVGEEETTDLLLSDEDEYERKSILWTAMKMKKVSMLFRNLDALQAQLVKELLTEV